MKRLLGVAAILLCSLSLPAFAAKNNSQNITIWNSTKVGAAQVPAGAYKVSWSGTGENVQVTMTQGKKTVATFPAKLVPADNSAVAVSTRTVEGTEVLETIQLNKCNLVLAPGEAASQQQEDLAH